MKIGYWSAIGAAFGLLVAEHAYAECSALDTPVLTGFLVMEALCPEGRSVVRQSSLTGTTDYAGLVIVADSLNMTPEEVPPGFTAFRFHVKSALTGHLDKPLVSGLGADVTITAEEPLAARIINTGTGRGITLTQAWCTSPRESLNGGHVCIMGKSVHLRKNFYSNNGRFVLRTRDPANLLDGSLGHIRDVAVVSEVYGSKIVSEPYGYDKVGQWKTPDVQIIFPDHNDSFSADVTVVFEKDEETYALAAVLPAGFYGPKILLGLTTIKDGDTVHMAFGDYRVHIADDRLRLEALTNREYDGAFLRFERMKAVSEDQWPAR